MSAYAYVQDLTASCVCFLCAGRRVNELHKSAFPRGIYNTSIYATVILLLVRIMNYVACKLNLTCEVMGGMLN